MIQVSVANEQSALSIDVGRLRDAVKSVLAAEHAGRAVISLAIVDNRAIHALNREFLAHDYATDVLSFVLEQGDGHLEGEVVASAEMAVEQAPRFGWPPSHELLLYVIHGTLHLAGYDDTTPEAAQAMRAAEQRHLAQLGLCMPPAKDEG